MGKYYSGDIEGKFRFAVQSSNAADRFGSIGCEPSYIEYYFNKDDNLEDVQLELKKIENIISIENIKKLDEFFKKVNGYNDNIMMEYDVLKIWNQHKSNYADYQLGKKLKNV